MSFLGHFWRILQRNQFTLSLARLSFGPSHFSIKCLELLKMGINHHLNKAKVLTRFQSRQIVGFDTVLL